MVALFNLHPVYSGLAFLGTILFVLKFALMMFSGDGTDLNDGNLDHVDHLDGGEQFALVSVQSILAFFMGAGWVGLAASTEWKLIHWQGAIAAGSFGFLMMLLNSFLTLKIKSLNSVQKNVNYKDAIGIQGRAYTNIPESGEGVGQVEVSFSGKLQVLQAISSSGAIKAFARVEVVDGDQSGLLTVKIIQESK